MKIVFRTDSSIKIGSGHIMRCLTLAEGLKKNGAEVTFICRDLDGNLAGLIRQKGFTVDVLHTKFSLAEFPDTPLLETTWENDAEQTIQLLKTKYCHIDWLIIDHYSLDRRWEATLRPFVKKIMVIDDLANRPHDCDVLLDQNLYNNMHERYRGLIPEKCQKLFGPEFAMLRPEFIKARKTLRPRDGTVKRIMVFLGGTDSTNQTTKVLESIFKLDRLDFVVDVIVGKSNPFNDQIKQLCTKFQFINYYCQVENMAQLMAEADFSIGAGGTATWERCFLGLPNITIIIAENQIEATETLASKGAIINLGWYADVNSEMLVLAINKCISSPKLLSSMSIKSQQLMGSPKGGTETVIKSIMEGL